MTDHAAEARRLLASDGAEHGDQGRVLTNALAAQVHATLALVEEQRTANLIAALTAGFLLDYDHEDEAWDFIAARLGLTPTTPGSES